MTDGRGALGWYVHHHGNGHRTRFLAIRPHLRREVIAFSTLPPPADLPPRTEWIELPRDDDGGAPQDPTVGGLLHWAPLGHDGHRARLAEIARAAATRGLAGMVVDVSVEVALLARLLGVTTIVMAQPGERTDEPHALAHRVAARIVAPWPARLVAAPALEAAADRVVHVGGISRFDGRRRAAAPTPGTVLALAGTAVPPVPGLRVSSPGWLDDPWNALCTAEVVVTAAGQNAIADLAAAGARAVVVPQDRPFGEQVATAGALRAAGLTVVAERLDGTADAAAALAEARELRPDWSRWQVAGAAARAAAAIEEAVS